MFSSASPVGFDSQSEHPGSAVVFVPSTHASLPGVMCPAPKSSALTVKFISSTGLIVMFTVPYAVDMPVILALFSEMNAENSNSAAVVLARAISVLFDRPICSFRFAKYINLSRVTCTWNPGLAASLGACSLFPLACLCSEAPCPACLIPSLRMLCAAL